MKNNYCLQNVGESYIIVRLFLCTSELIVLVSRMNCNYIASLMALAT